MERAVVNGVELEYEVRGSGEPVLLIGGSHVANAFAPLLAEPALASQYQLIVYQRRGLAGSTHTPPPVSIADQSADACGSWTIWVCVTRMWPVNLTVESSASSWPWIGRRSSSRSRCSSRAADGALR